MDRKRSLLRDRRFAPLFWTQFFGAFNDNAFKNALVILITMKAFSLGSVSSKQMVALCGGIFILPFFLFSATAGQLADRFAKSRMVVWIKVWEILVMAIGAYGFLTDKVLLLLATLFFMGMHSAFFGPVKYSILPQLLRPDELVSGNAYVEMGTFLAILLGTILGGALIAHATFGAQLISGAVLTLALFGWYASLNLMPLTPTAPTLRVRLNPLPPTWEMIKRVNRSSDVFWSILGISWFWSFGSAMLSVLPAYCKEFLQGQEALITLFLALFSVGIGIGSMLCGRLSAGKLELGLVPVGSLGMTLFAMDLFFTGHPGVMPAAAGDRVTIAILLSAFGGWRIVTDLLLLAIFGGFFIVPLYTLIQQRSPEAERSRVIAGNNILNALFVVVAALLLVLLFRLGFTIPQVFLTLALLNVAVGILICAIVPEFFHRFISIVRGRFQSQSRNP